MLADIYSNNGSPLIADLENNTIIVFNNERCNTTYEVSINQRCCVQLLWQSPGDSQQQHCTVHCFSSAWPCQLLSLMHTASREW